MMLPVRPYVLIVVSIFSCKPGLATETDTLPTTSFSHQELIQRSRAAVVRIVALAEVDGRPVPMVIGSGFVVGAGGFVITCNHVLPPPSATFFVVQADTTSFNKENLAEIMTADKQHDLALLRVPALASAPRLEIGNAASVRDGDDAVVMGFPMTNPVLTSSRAMIGARFPRVLDGAKVPTDLFRLDASVNSGNSGGPLISLSTGAVIGVVNAKEGGISENLKLFRETKPRAAINIGGVDPVEILRTTVTELERNTNLGIGHAISSKYVSAMLNR